MKKEYLDILNNSPLFKKIDESNYLDVLRLLNNKVKIYKKGQTIIHYDDLIEYAGIVIEGLVEATFLNESYNEISMNRFEKGLMFAEAYACKGSNKSPMELVAIEDSTILFIKISEIFINPNSNIKQQLLTNLINSLSDKNIFLNLKVRILSQKTLREKIIMYISSLPLDKDGYHINTLNQTSFANYINANRSALARELSKMELEGIIKIDKKRIKLIDNY